MMKKHIRWVYGIGTGALAGFLASLCCTGPALLTFLGLGSFGAGLGFTGYHSVLTGVGLALVGVTLWGFRPRSDASSCEQCPPKARWYSMALPAATITIFLVGHFLLTTMLAPTPNLSNSWQMEVQTEATDLKPAPSAPIRCASCDK